MYTVPYKAVEKIRLVHRIAEVELDCGAVLFSDFIVLDGSRGLVLSPCDSPAHIAKDNETCDLRYGKCRGCAVTMERKQE
jgi:hypothetical protein